METEIFGISFMVNDNFSLSYGENTTEVANNANDQELTSVQASYSMGGVSINFKDTEGTGVGNAANSNHDATELLVVFAF